MKDFIQNIFLLIKIKIILLVLFTTFLGYITFSKIFGIEFLLSIFGVFFLASSSTILNNLLDIEYDKKMERTKNRTLAIDQMKKKYVLILGLMSFVLGSILLLLCNYVCFLLGIFAQIWYVLFYTFLKRKTIFAVIPGALVGVIPPTIGWVAAGGGLFDKEVLVLGTFFFIWQIPHFWLLLFFYDNDYSKASLPSILKIFTSEQIIRISTIWLISLFFMGLLFVLFNFISTDIIKILMVSVVLLFSIFTFKNYFSNDLNYIALKSFKRSNLFVLLIIVLISIDKFIFN